MNKKAIVDHLLRDLHREIAVLLAAARTTREGATHEENRPENDKDTRAIEAGYLANGQAARVHDLKTAVAQVAATPLRTFAEQDPVEVSALVTVEVDGEHAWFFFVPAAGGVRYDGEGRSVQLITPRSPVGAALFGHRVGDVVEVCVQRTVREYEIVGIE